METSMMFKVGVHKLGLVKKKACLFFRIEVRCATDTFLGPWVVMTAISEVVFLVPSIDRSGPGQHGHFSGAPKMSKLKWWLMMKACHVHEQKDELLVNGCSSWFLVSQVWHMMFWWSMVDGGGLRTQRFGSERFPRNVGQVMKIKLPGSCILETR